MKTAILVVLAIIVVLVGGVLAYAATRPDTFRLQRSASINAPPETIVAYINDFRRWRVWSPWENLDPELKRTYSGAESGVGAVYAWEGNRQTGQGRMEIVEASPSKVALKLEFVRPFEANNLVELTLAPAAGATNVTWTMHGPNKFIAKVMSVFVNIDTMVGKSFETGLASLKAAAEKGPPAN